MKNPIRLTESDLTRIVRRVISEQGNNPNRCDEGDFVKVQKVLKNNENVTLSYNSLHSGVVHVTSSVDAAKLNCWCEKEEITQYIK